MSPLTGLGSLHSAQMSTAIADLSAKATSEIMSPSLRVASFAKANLMKKCSVTMVSANYLSYVSEIPDK